VAWGPREAVSEPPPYLDRPCAGGRGLPRAASRVQVWPDLQSSFAVTQAWLALGRQDTAAVCDPGAGPVTVRARLGGPLAGSLQR
jgi:hypothetical protein